MRIGRSALPPSDFLSRRINGSERSTEDAPLAPQHFPVRGPAGCGKGESSDASRALLKQIEGVDASAPGELPSLAKGEGAHTSRFRTSLA